ncbi:hypothetical protein [Streptosporangium sp. NBC_01756]|uniref:hypothetical protein n=1 Tax=Streptosporangium sp. NBC_01756 TaxID=2975950 RepID=UPI002DD98454|nr:hypothetical protein [Streptosporangium sp. NBC_01756]WSC86498.1 hypothetical protein OIE48_40165 [Streptosporangium sp. NBC_01756]
MAPPNAYGHRRTRRGLLGGPWRAQPRTRGRGPRGGRGMVKSPATGRDLRPPFEFESGTAGIMVGPLGRIRPDGVVVGLFDLVTAERLVRAW